MSKVFEIFKILFYSTTQNTNTNRWARNSSNVEPLKPCRDGFDCIPQHNGNAEHNARYSHPCQWLDLCRDINENEHSRHYTHPIDAIDVCQYGTANCTKLGDPEHRRTYRHVGLPYLLVPCKYGSRCEDRSTEHLKKFKHPPDFYQETNFNTASNVSNTKQECRYGANCRDQSDPTHRDRFQHPTKTSSLFVPATTSSQSSNTNSNTARSSRFHNIRGDDDDIEREHNIGGAMNSGRSSIQDQTTIKNTHQDTVSSFSNTKQECRYGANCRDQSDPTHRVRFQHPTKTSSLFVPAATGSQLSNMDFATSRSSHIHTNHGNDDMHKAYSIGGAIALERLSQQDQKSIKTMREDAIIVVPGTYDHIDQVLTKLNIKFTLVQQHELINYPLRTYQTVYINCASQFPIEAAHRLRDLVEKGLHLITTDWALRNVLQVAFPEFVRHNGHGTRDEVVGIEVADPNHPFVNGFVLAAQHAEPQWWLESASHLIEIVDKERVKVLIRSQALKDKYHSDAVIVTFDCGQGNVTHMISHFYLQRSETANARHKMPAQQYAQDIKASDNITKLITKDGQNLNYAQIQSSSTSAQFVYNLISNRLNSTNKSTSSTNSRKDFQ
ncbi:unnamed protein product [Rotaria sordida]|uniref:Uncharacterized protein n=1 Tax=Rotaria sordida TaxID=392033 RepID=A0A813ZZ75_9BILA|nr:unnamed protein product [Rotaria sordida]